MKRKTESQRIKEWRSCADKLAVALTSEIAARHIRLNATPRPGMADPQEYLENVRERSNKAVTNYLRLVSSDLPKK
jgi:hypothetical protein